MSKMNHRNTAMFVHFSRAIIMLSTLLSFSPAWADTPDFTGVWTRFPSPFGNERFPDNPSAPGGDPKLQEPYASQYEEFMQRKAKSEAQGIPLIDSSTQCLPEGMPTIMGAIYNIEIFQTADKLVVLAEFLNQIRRVYINSPMPDPDDIFPSYNGHSVAHWEDETLVIETLGVREDVQFFHFPHSENMKITERIRLTSPDTIENKVRIDDPQILSSPYEFTYGYKRDPGYQIYEYVCDDNRMEFNADGTTHLEMNP